MAPKKRPPVDRFMEKILKLDNGCHEWQAYRGENGYGRFYLDGKGALAHRWSYEHFVGPIPDGLQIDHLCRNHACVNPEHLEPVTASENVLRGIGPQLASERFRQKTEFPKGHPYSDENTYIRDGHGRTCMTCKRAHRKKEYALNRERAIARAAEWRRANPERARELAREGTRRYRQKLREKAGQA